MPSADEIFVRLKNAKWFSKLDLAAAYHQLPLSPESRPITAFITHCGLFQYKNLPYGLASAPAIFTRRLKSVIRNCKNVVSFLDDILVFGSSEKEHDDALEKVKKALQQADLLVNEAKCEYKVRELEYLGRTVTADGIKISRKALESIQNMPSPTNKSQIRSILGMFSFYRQYVPHYASISSQLHELVKNDVSFTWGEEQESAFRKLKEAITNAVPLAYFDTSRNTETFLTTDGSGDGIGAMLSQVSEGKERPVYFISRKTTAQESKFSASELETLAVIWSIERLHQFLYGRHFTIRTDHRCLPYVLNGSAENMRAPARIVRWSYRLLPYCFDVKYLSGKQNVIADALSRRPTENAPDFTEYHVSALLKDNDAVSTIELEEATKNDDVLKMIVSKLQLGWSDDAAVTKEEKVFKGIQQELSVVDGILHRGERIVVPTILRQRLLQQGHQGHLGIVKTKQKMRQMFWWPQMDHEIESYVKNCKCFRPIPPRDTPVQNVDWPTSPFLHLAIDIAGPKTDEAGQQFYVLVAVDYHSRYVIANTYYKPIVSSDIIGFLSKIFTTFGFCLKLTSDNGSVFISTEFTSFLKTNGIIHNRSAAYNPQANGLVERVNRNIKKFLENAKLVRGNCQAKLDEYMFAYNNSEHETLKCSPASLVFKFLPRTKMAMCVPPPAPTEDILRLQEEIQRRQRRYAFHANDRRRPRITNPFKPGDLVRNNHGRIYRLARATGPYTFRTVNGPCVNIRHLQLIPATTPQDRNDQDDDHVPVLNPSSQGSVPRRNPHRVRKLPAWYQFS